MADRHHLEALHRGWVEGEATERLEVWAAVWALLATQRLFSNKVAGRSRHLKRGGPMRIGRVPMPALRRRVALRSGTDRSLITSGPHQGASRSTRRGVKSARPPGPPSSRLRHRRPRISRAQWRPSRCPSSWKRRAPAGHRSSDFCCLPALDPLSHAPAHLPDMPRPARRSPRATRTSGEAQHRRRSSPAAACARILILVLVRSIAT